MEALLQDILDELRSINAKLGSIEDVLPLVRPTYDLDDIHSRIDDLAESITGPLGYNLGDLHKQTADMASTLSMIEINTSA
jgi:hypothetical protein